MPSRKRVSARADDRRRFGEAERQVLALLRAIRARPQDWDNGQRIVPDAETLRRHGALFFGEALVAWPGTLERLVEAGWVSRRQGRYALTEKGLPDGTDFQRFFLDRGFGRLLLARARSRAHDRFCEQVFGVSLCQCSLLDAEQLRRAIDCLALAPGDRALDLGCGVGRVAEYLADTTGARVTGVDVASAAISRAERRTRARRDQVRYLHLDLNTADLPSRRFDAALAVDTLYLVNDLTETLGRIASSLRPGGRIVILGSEVLAPGVARDFRLAPSRTKLGRALRHHGLKYVTDDFTENECAIWRRQKAVARALRSEFVAEGNTALYRALTAEADRSLRWVAEGRVRRFLFHARVPA